MVDARQRFIRAVWIVGILNLLYFCVEFGFAMRLRSVSLSADSVDFLEDAALNALVLIGVGWPLAHRAVMGKWLAVLLVLPCLFTIWMAIQKWTHPSVPSAEAFGLVATGALVVNLFCAFQLVQFRNAQGSLAKAAFLSARNDALANVAIICAALITARNAVIWPDLVVGLGIIGLNAGAAIKVYKAADVESEKAESQENATPSQTV